jgi:hypothetical protein
MAWINSILFAAAFGSPEVRESIAFAVRSDRYRFKTYALDDTRKVKSLIVDSQRFQHPRHRRQRGNHPIGVSRRYRLARADVIRAHDARHRASERRLEREYRAARDR